MEGDPREQFMRDGKWPCQQIPRGDVPPRLVAFLYRLLRDGASAPGDVEDHMLNAGSSNDRTEFTNLHLERLARAHATFLLEERET